MGDEGDSGTGDGETDRGGAAVTEGERRGRQGSECYLYMLFITRIGGT